MRFQRPRPLSRRPRVSVVVPHYNYGPFLADAVESALAQPGIDVHVIIVDDASTDGSASVARELAQRFARVTLVEHEHNLRHIRTYNDGLSRATGEYLVLLSADDVLAPGSLSRSVALLESNPSVGLVYGRIAAFEDAMPEFGSVPQWWQIWDGEQWLAHICRRGRNMIANPEVVMRASVYADIGGYDQELPHAADMLMWLQAAARSDVGFVGGPRQAYYRIHGENMHTTQFTGVLDDMEQVRDVFLRFFAGEGSSVKDGQCMRVRALASVAREALLRAALLGAEGAPDSTVVALREFASATSPDVLGSPTWTWASSPGRWPASAIRAAEHARWKIRSRRTDLVGL
ncbi:glycosyltransferase family 2 protein [Microbacterium sp. zg-YB36]|uniref:glycosyltransferase family 2 protein n=1 Tax=Microbacterium sp. zg-YB36 TaxID=2969407 RepID=UPI00214B93F7|nr:glycosyltransferase family 2 protein [Microbacterium sp. zg-YB36]MDL5352362.1 glycosyltransferase family 2 protein [Microbacterium sp. zg-YB36]